MAMVRRALLCAAVTAAAGASAQRSDADGHWDEPPCAGTSNRHCPLGQRSDGPSIGNGDLGAMIGGGAGGSSRFFVA